MRPSERADKLTRDLARSSGRSCHLPSAFYAELQGDIPTRVASLDITTAREVVRMLTDAKSKCKGLTRNEHTRLGHLLRKWHIRATGKDIRFNVMGTRPGRPTFHEQDRMASLGWVSTFTHKPKEPILKTCLCGAKFETIRSDKKWCSATCRDHHWWLLKGKQDKPLEGNSI